MSTSTAGTPPTIAKHDQSELTSALSDLNHAAAVAGLAPSPPASAVASSSSAAVFAAAPHGTRGCT